MFDEFDNDTLDEPLAPADLTDHAGDEHGPRPHYHVEAVDSGTIFPVFFFTGSSIGESEGKPATPENIRGLLMDIFNEGTKGGG